VRISQLAAEAGVPVATIKFYLRERLLHDGKLTSATQATYDESHVRRLRLIRALAGSAGLSIAGIREVLAAIDDPPESGHDLLGIAHHAVTPHAGNGVDVSAARELMARLGWDAASCDPDTLASLASALNALDDADFHLDADAVDRYARSMMELARTEVADVPTDSAESAARYVVLGTVLVEPLLLALRRLAQQTASAERFGSRRPLER
jgi:DNA-binding transcriptional MerR regulator